MTACSAVENGCPTSPTSPQLDGLSKEISSPADNQPGASDQEAKPHQDERAASAAGAGGGGGVSHTHFTFEVGLEQEETLPLKIHPNVEPTIQNGNGVKEEVITAVLQDNGQEKQTANFKEEQIETVLNRRRDVQPSFVVEENGIPCPDRIGVEEKEKRCGPGEQIDQIFRITSLPNGLEQGSSSHSELKETEEREEAEEEGFSPSPVPSKEDSVTEEKEMEDRKSVV